MRTFALLVSTLALFPSGRLVAEEPAVRVLGPGFRVQPLPVRLTNVNNLAFSPDGKLYALGYDGRVHRLIDSDGDGLEDRAETFWDRPTIRVPVGLAWSPEGLYVSSHGKVSLLKDDDGDGKADREEIVADGWPPTDVPSGGVDALGVTLDRAGNLYFGLGTPDYSNAYRLKDGKPRYDLKGERGAILKLSPDRKRREVVATGIRFPYALRFNRHGDLFATDQEGETWLPGGNPLDELNQIVPGRHYGFPPRHDAYLPGVIDEAPVVGFGPQHQSTCGMVFNEAKPGWKSFGPASWDGDAFVTGFSRGKVWRVRLVKTTGGYVGRPTLFARSSMMMADVAVSPSGAMYLCGHSGPPDWGSGPKGEGRLFRITYADPDAPQAVAAWASGPMEVRVAFDRPIDPATTTNPSGLAIRFGPHVRAADRFEVHKPPYKAVEEQAKAPVGTLHASAARLVDGGRTLVLATDPHPWAATYALTLPGVRREGQSGAGTDVDLDYALNGVEASWTPTGADRPSWTRWWPHIDPGVVAALTAGSSEHDRDLASLGGPGKLAIRCLVRLPSGRTTIRVDAQGPASVHLGESGAISASTTRGRAEVTIGTGGGRVPLAIEATTPSPDLRVSYQTDSDPTNRPLSIDRLLLPWAVPAPVSPPATVAVVAKQWEGGDPGRGETVFFSEAARCSACHKVRGRGSEVGPDLSNLVHRDAQSVYRDISDPSAAIHPDYVPFSAALKDGRVLTGLVRSEGDAALRVIGTDAKPVVIRRDEVEELRPSATSVMPNGIAPELGDAKLRDLIAFLLTSPRSERPGEPKEELPPKRTQAEVEAVLGSPVAATAKPRDIKIILVAGRQDHGPGEHDYPAWQSRWKTLLETAPGVTVATANNWPDKDQWRGADLVVLNLWNHDWSPDRFADLDAFLARGGGVVAIHAAVIADKDPEALARRFGLAAQPVRTKYRHGPLDLTIAAPPEHPITRGLASFHLIDETYWPMIGDTSKVSVLATAVEEGKPHPMFWTFEVGKGRVFGSVLGHYTWTLDDPFFRIPVLRGMAWAAREPIERFERLAGR